MSSIIVLYDPGGYNTQKAVRSISDNEGCQKSTISTNRSSMVAAATSVVTVVNNIMRLTRDVFIICVSNIIFATVMHRRMKKTIIEQYWLAHFPTHELFITHRKTNT